MIYPIGLSTTWDHTVHTIFDGQDVQKYRSDINVKFERDFLVQVAMETPNEPGRQYVLIMSGATMSARQIFTASVDESETRESIWASPFKQFEEKTCGSYVEHPFIHPGGVPEKVLWPIIAIAVDVM